MIPLTESEQNVVEAAGRDSERVVLVDERDNVLGEADKVAVHRTPGRLHRAVSAWLTDPLGRIVVQRRAKGKYHFAGRWSNACCTHPRPGESSQDAIERRVREELGAAVELGYVGSFLYHACDPASGLVEYELDHVFSGVVEEHQCEPDLAEIEAVAFVEPTWLLRRVADGAHSSEYTPWLADVCRIVGLPVRRLSG